MSLRTGRAPRDAASSAVNPPRIRRGPAGSPSSNWTRPAAARAS